MGQQTSIAWTHHTFNAWIGCAKISPGCAHCYAEPLANRIQRGLWGVHAQRRIASEDMWDQPHHWNRAAARAGQRRRVFCASMADVFEDRPDLVEPRKRLFELIDCTAHLDWLLLTKRPQHSASMLPEVDDGHGGRLATAILGTPGKLVYTRPNLWLGVSVENQKAAEERIPLLLQIPAAVRFLSVEPLLEPVDLTPWLDQQFRFPTGPAAPSNQQRSALHWVIVGGESGSKARPCDLEWIRSVLFDATKVHVPCFVKQVGTNPLCGPDLGQYGNRLRLGIHDPKGSDPAEWPEDLRVQQFPR